MKKRLIALACCLASSALAQLGGGYLGPAVLSSGASGVGNRSGQQVDLRFYAGVDGFYDSSIQPVAVNSQGQLVTFSGLYGVEANIGLYGTHSWRTAQLGVDYHGAFREYANQTASSGIDQFLSLGYTWQESRRLSFQARGLGGILNDALSGIGAEPAGTSATSVVIAPQNLVFDSRSYYLQGGLDMTYQTSVRTSFTLGGQGFEVWRQSAFLVGMEGYGAHGSVEHRLNRNTSIGLTYQRQHYSYPKVFGHADIDTGEAFIGTNLGPLWTFTLSAGVFHAEVSGLQTVLLSPVIAALLGQSSTVQAFYRDDIYPSGSAALNRKFKKANMKFYYSQTVLPGNGIYFTSRAENAGASYSYTGIRKVNLSVSGGYNALGSIGQGIPPYKTYTAGGGITYTLPWSLHLDGRFDYRDQSIEGLVYKHNGYRTVVGLTFSPGKVPLSLW